MDLNPVFTPVRDLGAFIRDQRTAGQISLRQLAKRAGVSNPYLSQVERGLRKPSADILAQIAHGLQISVEHLLTVAGVLEPTTDARAVEFAVQADPMLTEPQKASLIQIYRSFRRDTEALQGDLGGSPDLAVAGDQASGTPGDTSISGVAGDVDPAVTSADRTSEADATRTSSRSTSRTRTSRTSQPTTTGGSTAGTITTHEGDDNVVHQ